jgi:FtsH-binding integral membrane protein
MNAETPTKEAIETQPKSKRLSSLIWIVVLWAGVRLFSELHPIYWTHLFLYTAIGLGVFPATLALLLSMGTKNLNRERIYRWTAFLVLATGLCIGAVLQVFESTSLREVCVVTHWVVLLIGVWSAHFGVSKREE